MENYEEKIKELKAEVSRLKSRIGGYARHNLKYQQTIASLKEEIKRRIDELLETKSRYMKELEKYEKYDEQNSESINELYRTIEGLKREVATLGKEKIDLKGERDFYEANYEYFMSLPWYKKMFARKGV